MNELAVQKGREWLDAHSSDWRAKINFDTLDIRTWSRCILGQIFGINCLPQDYPHDLIGYGFSCGHLVEDNVYLIELWRKEVNGH